MVFESSGDASSVSEVSTVATVGLKAMAELNLL